MTLPEGREDPPAEGFRRLAAEAGARLRERPPLERTSYAALAGFVVFLPFSISAAQIFAYGGILLWAASLWRAGNWREVRLPLWAPFLLFAALTVLSASLADAPARSLGGLGQLFQILIFFWALNLLRTSRETLLMFKLLLAAAAVVCLYALLMAVVQPIGLAHRLSGFYSIYMTFGGVLMIVASLTAAYLLLPGGRRREGWIWVAAGLLLAALLATFSRNAWLGFLAAVLVLGAIARSGRALFLLAGVLILAFLFAPESVRQRIRSIGDLKDVTAVERVFMWRSGFRMIRERPFFGFGLNGIKPVYSRFADPKAKKQRTGHLHNNLLQVAAERGIPALGAWIWLWVAFFAGALRRGPPPGGGSFERRFRTAGGLAAVAAFLVAGLFEFNFGDSEVVMTAYFAMALPFAAEAEE